MAYVNKNHKKKIIKYTNDLLFALADFYRHQNCDDSKFYYYKFNILKDLYIGLIEDL